MKASKITDLCLLALATAASAQPVSPGAGPIERARTLRGSGESTEALDLLREIVRADPGNAQAHNMLGSVLNSDGHYAEALPHAETAVRLDPANARFRYNRGVILAEHGRFREAISDFDIALAAHPELTYGWLERGAAKLSLDDVQGAEADWRQAEKADPALIWTTWYMATGDFVAGRFAEAAAGFDKVSAAEPEFAPAKVWRMIAHGRAGSPVADPEPASGEWPAPVLNFYLGRVDAGELLRAASVDKTTGDRRRVAEANFFLAQHVLIRGDRNAAVRYLRAALAESAPRHVWRIAAERDLAEIDRR